MSKKIFTLVMMVVLLAPSGVSAALPKAINLGVPFTSQAPYANWGMPYQESCEEASMIMADAFYKHKSLNKKNSDSAIQQLVTWETKRFGDYKDQTAEEVGIVLREYFGYKNVKVIYDVTVDDIKKAVSDGHPLIVPAAGRLLGNKNFRQPGPLYHMLVVRGWKKDGTLIINDPGTRNGKAFLYKPDVLMNAIHDWNNGDVLKGRKVMVVVEEKI